MHRKHEDEMKRRIVIMIKTTGDEPKDGHRMTEIACVELRDLEETGNNFHTFLFPGNDKKHKLMDMCQHEYQTSDRLKPETNAAKHTAEAMMRVPKFTKAEAKKLEKMGVSAYLSEKMWAAPDFHEIEKSFMDYLRRSPNTVIVTHDMGRLKKFLRNEMSPKNWIEFEENYHDPKHGMMQKMHKLRPIGLFPKTRGVWSKGLGFEPIAERFEVPLDDRTGFSAMQEAIKLAEIVRLRKMEKMEKIKMFPKDIKFFREHPEELAALEPVKKMRKKR